MTVTIVAILASGAFAVAVAFILSRVMGLRATEVRYYDERVERIITEHTPEPDHSIKLTGWFSHDTPKNWSMLLDNEDSMSGLTFNINKGTHWEGWYI